VFRVSNNRIHPTEGLDPKKAGKLFIGQAPLFGFRVGLDPKKAGKLFIGQAPLLQAQKRSGTHSPTVF
jgi:uracil-DNA glycosylase